MRDDEDFEAALRRAVDGKTKPLGALGRLEDLATRIARLQRSLAPRMERCTLTIFAGDHGIAAEGVSAYPQAVTREMVANFLAGGAAATVFAATLGVQVRVVDAGVAGPPLAHPDLISRRIGPGTASFLRGPAMSPCRMRRRARRRPGARGRIARRGRGLRRDGHRQHRRRRGPRPQARRPSLGGPRRPRDRPRRRGPPAQAPGPRRGRRPHRPTLDPDAALAQYGGFEIAMMAGAMIGAAERGKLVLVDGFIATAAALAAERLAPEARAAFVFAHLSAEAGHNPLLDRMDARPLLALDMRLGEGTGALLAWPIVRAAAAMLRDMASFESAGVSRA
jgi:nicotinate-nucleotide--dimethylbenzimidazole phosphoribosyltransferase